MTLYLRKVIHPPAHDNYRVILKRDGDEFEIGSIGIQHGAAWTWGIDTRHPDARFRDARGRQGQQGLHAAVQGGVGPLHRRRGQPRRVHEREAEEALTRARGGQRTTPRKRSMLAWWHWQKLGLKFPQLVAVYIEKS